MDRRTVALVPLAVGAGLVPLAFFLPAVGSLAVVYLVTGVAVTVAVHRSPASPLGFRVALGGATVALLAVGVLLAWRLTTARPALDLADATFWSIVSDQLLRAVPAAAMLPLGASRRVTESALVVGLTLVPFAVSLGDWLSQGTGFGPTVAVAYHSLTLLGGAFLGLPLYGVARRLGPDRGVVPGSHLETGSINGRRQ